MTAETVLTPASLGLPPRFSAFRPHQPGWDFPGSQCELILIPKLPLPAKSSAVETERLRDGEYRMNVAIQTLVQQAGRARRHAADRCEVVVFDAMGKWAIGSPREPWRGHAPKWFRLHEIAAIPPAPPRLEDRR